MGAGAGAGAASGTTAPPRISRAGSRSSFAWSTNPIFKQADGAAAGDSPVSAVSPGGGGEGAGASGASPFHLHVSDVPVLPRLLPQHVEAARSGMLPSGLELTAQQRARVQTLVAAAQLELQLAAVGAAYRRPGEPAAAAAGAPRSGGGGAVGDPQ